MGREIHSSVAFYRRLGGLRGGKMCMHKDYRDHTCSLYTMMHPRGQDVGDDLGYSGKGSLRHGFTMKAHLRSFGDMETPSSIPGAYNNTRQSSSVPLLLPRTIFPEQAFSECPGRRWLVVDICWL